MKRGIVASDLLEERANLNFDSNEMMEFVMGKDSLEYAKKWLALIDSDPVVRPSQEFKEMTRQELADL